MATWTNIPTDRIEPGKPIRAIDGLALRDNPIAIAMNAAGAPKITLNVSHVTASASFTAPKSGAYLVICRGGGGGAGSGAASGGVSSFKGVSAAGGAGRPSGGPGTPGTGQPGSPAGGMGRLSIAAVSMVAGETAARVVGAGGSGTQPGGSGHVTIIW